MCGKGGERVCAKILRVSSTDTENLKGPLVILCDIRAFHQR